MRLHLKKKMGISLLKTNLHCGCFLVLESYISHCSCGMLVSHHSTNSYKYKGKHTLVLIHSGIVNRYQLLCDAHTVLEQHRGNCSFISILLIIVLFHFFFYGVFVTLTVTVLFSWGVPL